MKTQSPTPRNRGRKWLGRLAALCAGVLLPGQAVADFTLNVVDGAGAPVSNYRWLLEQDNTSPVTPGVPRNDSVSLVIHKSHAPVQSSGSSASSSTTVTADPLQKYAVSVIADGYSLGGANVAAGQPSVTVILNKHPIPTAQISVLAFHDSNPINNVPDATEPGLAGFKVVLFDFLGGPMLQDAFGNPLGTTYEFDTNTGEPLLDAEDAPVVKKLGNGNIYTDANGKALVKYIAMGKYGVQVIPPNGSDWTGGHGSANVRGAWHQTATIEGTQTVDAWVKANEPMIFIEGFGVGTYHVFFGYVDPAKTLWATNPPAPGSGVTVTGVNRFNHFGRPPTNQQFAVGPPVSEAWVALNEINALGAAGVGLYAAPCDPATGEFTITNVPPGTYQLVTWDKPLSALFGMNTIIVSNAPVNNLGSVLSMRWFGTLEGSIFYDTDQDGFKDATEVGIPNMAVNIRWRDGTIYQATVTDSGGDYQFSQVFPFFKWLVTEVDFSRFKATGMTSVTDEGGVISPDNGWLMPSEGVRNPQPQYDVNPDGTLNLASPVINTNTGNNLARTEVGPVLLEATHLFLNQNNRIDWGKVDYAPGENGGISGIVGYQTTRAETDPRNATIDPWEPGVPRVQVVLYRDANGDKIIDDLDGSGGPTPSDIDNYPFNWTQPVAPALPTRGPEDVDHNNNGTFDPGDAVQVAWTDSWDGVAEENPTLGALQPNPPVILGRPIIGSDNYGTWNQIRPQVFDGGYLFESYYAGGLANTSATNVLVSPLPVGNYIVQTCPPKGYLIQTEESFNVVFGDAYIPSKLWIPPECVGTAANHVGDLNYVQSIVPGTRTDAFTVADFLSLFPDQGEPAPFAGEVRPLADMKWVTVSGGQNAACDFHVYTEVPKSTRVVGFVLNDLTAEFNAFSPIFGEKGSPGWLPISFRDWAGHEVARTYSDEYGSYEALLPSTYNVAAPMPSGVAPNMLTMVLNDPTMPDPANPGSRLPDPNYNPAFATTPWTLHYYPGTFLYADTPIVPQAGFVGFPNKQLDVEPPNNTPLIQAVSGTAVGGLAGPYVANLSDTITIRSMGTVNVPDPNCLGYGCNNTVARNFSFGPYLAGTSRAFLVVNGETNDLVLVGATPWNAARITCRLPATISGPVEGQLMVTRNNGRTTPIGVTLTYDPDTTKVRFVNPIASATPIQDAIDLANPGDLIIVPTNSLNYNENPILWKPVRLQGSGLATVINANPTPADRLAAWHAKVKTILGGDPFIADESPGIMVLGQNILGVGGPVGTLSDSGFATTASRIDGFQIKGAIAGGGIVLFDQVANLRISNNRVQGNQGTFAGGIAVGEQGAAGTIFRNPNVTIEYNQIFQNGGVSGAGGIGLFTGATGYKVRNNYIMGNFTRGSGGGISHEGLSPGGLIANNAIAYNEVFYGVPAAGVFISGDGGGIFVGGEAAAVAGGLGSGAGSVTIVNNLIQGNLAGGGHGGGIRAASVNGNDVATSGNANNWYRLDIFNNVIVNNAAAFYGGGISLQDATRVRILHNTIANNDSTATAQGAFAAGASTSTSGGAGIMSHQHSATLAGLAGQQFSNPLLRNNILWHNRSFAYDRIAATLVPNPPATPVYVDVAVEGGFALSPQDCLFSNGAGAPPTPAGAGNFRANPGFVLQRINTNQVVAVIDEAGNNLALRFSPIGIYRPNGADQADYHVGATSPALLQGANIAAVLEVATDIDRNARNLLTPDIGADQYDASDESILPPWAPDITVAIMGPLPTGTPPAVTTPIVGAGVPPGDPLAPLNLNALPGDPLKPLVDPEPAIDSDGDGNPANDIAYIHLTAGDGLARMADGNELYTFGFSDVTELTKTMTAYAAAQPTAAAQEGVLRQITPEVMKVGTLAANISAPTLVVKEGQHVHLDLSNVGMMLRPDLFDPHTVHFHGFPQAASIFDGEPMASISINMGATLRYYYNIVEPGTYLYHCHVEATEHMEMGMLGNLWVLPKQNNTGYGNNAQQRAATRAKLGGNPNSAAPLGYVYNDGDGSTRYDVEAPLQMGGMDRTFHEEHIAVQPLPFSTLDESYPSFNGRGYPDTINPNPIANSLGLDAQKVSSLVTARKGQKVLLRLSNVSISDFHTLTVLGIPMTVVGKDARLLRGPGGKNLAYQTTSITLGGGEAADVILDTTNVAPGTYFVYDARLNHLSNDQEDFGGMMTEIVITAP